MSQDVAIRLFISGRVQGVWFRGWPVETAGGRGLRGWVRNRRDGRVEALVSGPADQVEAFVAAVRRGPSLARVDDVVLVEAEAESFAGFEVRPTA